MLFGFFREDGGVYPSQHYGNTATPEPIRYLVGPCALTCHTGDPDEIVIGSKVDFLDEVINNPHLVYRGSKTVQDRKR